ncbi:MAG: ATP-binding cassette domain-containing protein [Propionibacteriaceae bacterium]|nr:ATP-binding cassette domain-containing protein [Propionibacteriaceae bacterium]
MSGLVSTLVVEDLGYRYPGGATEVLSGIDVRLEGGRMYAFMGPSGSGKSTLLSLIGLLMRPSTGRVVLDGVDTWALHGSAEAVRSVAFAWVLQNVACLEARSAVDNVALGLWAQGIPTGQARQIAIEALARVGLTDRREARATELSGGELQRMTIARAMASNRLIILADEPTGQLDAANSASVTDAIRTCAEDGQMVVIATHDMSVAAQCDEVFTIKNGSIEDHTIVTSPAHPDRRGNPWLED